MSVMNMVDEGLEDGNTYEDLHDVLLRIKAQMLLVTAYTLPRRMK